MERIEIVGIRPVDFTDKQGHQVVGTSLYYLQDDDRTNGKVAGKLFVGGQARQSMQYFPVVGDVVEVSYNRFGRACDFVLCG